MLSNARPRSGGAATRHRSLQPLVHLALMALVCTFTDGFASEPEAANNEGGTESAEWRHVTRVIDGDTIVLDGGERVRLIGVDTPETVPETRRVLREGGQRVHPPDGRREAGSSGVRGRGRPRW